MRKRGLRDKARNQFEPIKGEFPGAEFPLAVVQIDHTEANVIVVEEETRLPMGRPWITLAIDVFTRMVVGVFVSMEKPSAVAAGMCLAMGILPKNEYLASLEVPGEWPVWGKMRSVHADNAREFRGAMLEKACETYAIDLQWRPVKLPHYGGHIERLMGTASTELRKLPGATFASPKEREGYDSEKESALTLHEFERDLVDFIVNIYHQRKHAELDVPPRKLWELGILGDSLHKGIGVPAIPSDPSRVRLDFLPFVTRSVQRYGLLIDDICYYHEVLNGWINAMDIDIPSQKRQFIVRRDPRDISVVYFFDPETKQYYAIPYRNPAHPPISLWELKAVQARLREEGRKAVDEDTIFDAVERRRARIQESIVKTKAARRQQHRAAVTQKMAAKQNGGGSVQSTNAGTTLPVITQETNTSVDDIFSQDIAPFEDIEVKA
jgi:putative transposase